MGLISGFTLIRAISLFHITAAYVFLTNPRLIADQNLVFILGEAMELPQVTCMDKPNEATGFIAVILAFIGLADLTAASLEEVAALQYWLPSVQIRLTFLFGLATYTYLFKEGGLLGPSYGQKAGIGEPLQNSLVFAWAFFETIMWFWVFTSLRDDRREIAQRMIDKKRAEENSL